MSDVYGLDITTWAGGVPDLDPLFGEVSGEQAVLECVARRFITTTGTLEGDPDFGTDLRIYMSARMSPIRLARLKQAIVAEALKEERVLSCTVVSVDPTAATNALRVSITIQLATGTFPLTLEVSSLTVRMLHP